MVVLLLKLLVKNEKKLKEEDKMKETDYVTVKIPFKEVRDKETGMMTRNYDVSGIDKQLCQGWDVDASEDGAFIVNCDCNQCVNLENRRNNYIEDWEFYQMEDLR
tara:strand:+ start:189 stop:503 length:315 start_codon:yes stop_codon:yes gene_type:complete